nr:lipase maturation factor 1 isoform X3 [Macaca nemestrina]
MGGASGSAPSPHMRPDGPTMAAPEESLRRRKTGYSHPEPESPPVPGRDPAGSPAHLHAGTFWLTRIVLLKALAFVYFVAFLVAFHQNKQLIGDRGLLPCRVFLKNFQQYFQDKTSWEVFSYMPTILWLTDWSDTNSTLDSLALLGLGISSFVLITGCANMLLMAALWGLYMSLVNVGHVWYSFGWESQLLETGFLGIFLCPLWTLSRLPQHTPTSRIVLWGFRWLIFRIMLGAGLIKIRGDRCWRDLTCMDFHYEEKFADCFLRSGPAVPTCPDPPFPWPRAECPGRTGAPGLAVQCDTATPTSWLTAEFQVMMFSPSLSVNKNNSLPCKQMSRGLRTLPSPRLSGTGALCPDAPSRVCTWLPPAHPTPPPRSECCSRVCTWLPPAHPTPPPRSECCSRVCTWPPPAHPTPPPRSECPVRPLRALSATRGPQPPRSLSGPRESQDQGADSEASGGCLHLCRACDCCPQWGFSGCAGPHGSRRLC